jgi:hypothetical protein
MSKGIMPIMGYPIEEYLRGLERNEARELNFTANTGSCMNENQAQHVVWELKENNPNMSELKLQVLNYRLDCENCLNRDCTRREPEKPYELVAKRAKEMIDK